MARAVLVLTVVLYARALEITLNLGEDDPEARLSFSATDDLPARAMEFASERGLVAGAARVVEDAMRRRVHRTRAFSLEVPGCAPRSFGFDEVEAVFNAQQDVWEDLGSTNPFWSVLSGRDYDVGNGISPAKARDFYQTGEETVAALLARVALLPGLEHLANANASAPPHRGTVLDFGCGLGRLAVAFAGRYERVLCVDHSSAHLQAAKKSVEFLFPERAARIVTLAAGPDLLGALDAYHAQIPEAPPTFELAVSLIALQHMVPQLQVVYLEQLCDVLTPGRGVGLIQFLSFYEDSAYVASDCDPQRAIDEPGMQLHWLPLSEVYAHLERRGCFALHALECDNMVSMADRRTSSHCVVFGK